MEKENEEKIDENVTKSRKMELKKVLIIVACIIILVIGSNVYATSQGYNNIFFLIKHAIQGESITDKNEILSDRDITISYQPIEIGKGLQVQINRLVVKDNEAKLYLRINEENKIGDITPLNYIITNDNNEQLCNQNSAKDSISSVYTDELILKNFKENTKIINLEILDKDNISIVNLKVNLETKEIEVYGEEQLKKISESELKEYLSAFALLDYQPEDSYESYNERKLLASIALYNNVLNSTSTENLEAKQINELVKSIIDVPIESNGYIKVENKFFKLEELNNKMYYSYQGYEYINALCINVDNITYNSGVYIVDFTYCYPTNSDYESNNIENIPLYKNTIELQLNENSKYSKYFVKNIGIPTEVSNNTTNEIVGDKLNIVGTYEGEIEDVDVYYYKITLNSDYTATFSHLYKGDEDIEEGTYTIKNNYVYFKYTTFRDITHPEGVEITSNFRIIDENTLLLEGLGIGDITLKRTK